LITLASTASLHRLSILPSVAIWFNESPISAPEAESFQTSAHADETKDGKQRTLVQIMFCPGGGATTASATAVKSIDLNTNHAKSPLLGVQWAVEPPKDLKVEKMTERSSREAP
jgi:hypothetical protein